MRPTGAAVGRTFAHAEADDEIGAVLCFLDAGLILEQGDPEAIFTAPREPRTQQFLQRIIDAGRL